MAGGSRLRNCDSRGLRRLCGCRIRDHSDWRSRRMASGPELLLSRSPRRNDPVGVLRGAHWHNLSAHHLGEYVASKRRRSRLLARFHRILARFADLLSGSAVGVHDRLPDLRRGGTAGILVRADTVAGRKPLSYLEFHSKKFGLVILEISS